LEVLQLAKVAFPEVIKDRLCSAHAEDKVQVEAEEAAANANGARTANRSQSSDLLRGYNFKDNRKRSSDNAEALPK